MTPKNGSKVTLAVIGTKLDSLTDQVVKHTEQLELLLGWRSYIRGGLQAITFLLGLGLGGLVVRSFIVRPF